MKAHQRYKEIFGEMRSLNEQIPWTTGVSNLFEWCAWATDSILGITKTQYTARIVQWCDEVKSAPLEEKLAFVKRKIEEEKKNNDCNEPHKKLKRGIVSPTEALRRAKFFSEDYLNKEFDIFWGLASDTYLDQFYGRFFSFSKGGRWFCHGNSGLFSNSTRITDMQMDNLSYNPDQKLLVANELKLGGKKNPDQILKYALMQKQLMERQFIKPETRLVLFFIGKAAEAHDWNALIDEEILYCRMSQKTTVKRASECADIARNIEFMNIAWADIFKFNEDYKKSLNAKTQQVELKLVEGFNESLRQKAFLGPF